MSCGCSRIPEFDPATLGLSPEKLDLVAQYFTIYNNYKSDFSNKIIPHFKRNQVRISVAEGKSLPAKVDPNYNKDLDKNHERILVRKYSPFDTRAVLAIILEAARHLPYVLDVLRLFTKRELAFVVDMLLGDDIIASKRFPLSIIARSGSKELRKMVLMLAIARKDAKRIYWMLGDQDQLPDLDTELAAELVRVSCRSGKQETVKRIAERYSLNAKELSHQALIRAIKKKVTSDWYPVLSQYIAAAIDFVWGYQHLQLVIDLEIQPHYRLVLWQVAKMDGYDPQIAIQMVVKHKCQEKIKKRMVEYIIDPIIAKAFETNDSPKELATAYIKQYRELFGTVPSYLRELWFRTNLDHTALEYVLEQGYELCEYDIYQIIGLYMTERWYESDGRDYYGLAQQIKQQHRINLVRLMTWWKTRNWHVKESDQIYFEKLTELYNDGLDDGEVFEAYENFRDAVRI